jgi:hypothetical protein
MNNARCGRADPISRQGGWQADMHRYDVDVDAVVWSGTFLGETPVRMSATTRDHGDQISQCACQLTNTISFWRGSAIWKAVVDDLVV